MANMSIDIKCPICGAYEDYEVDLGNYDDLDKIEDTAFCTNCDTDFEFEGTLYLSARFANYSAKKCADDTTPPVDPNQLVLFAD